MQSLSSPLRWARNMRPIPAFQARPLLTIYKPYIEDLNSTREAIGQKLNSPYAQKVYLQESRSIQARSVFSAAAHSGRGEELCDWLNPVAD